MVKQRLANIIVEKMGVDPTNSQSEAITQLSEFLFATDQDSAFLLKGYAGTGKTLLVSAIVEALVQFRVKTTLIAPTGRAAKVLSNYSNKPAYTIHKLIYRMKSGGGGSGKFSLDYNKASDTLFIVDEASMIADSSLEASSFGSGRLLEDLFEYVYNGKNCRLMIVGDSAQLPPVNLTISPALDKSHLEGMGLSIYSSTLSHVVRQSESSGILYNATLVRQKIKLQETNEFFKINLKNFPDIHRISGENLIESITESYDQFGEDGTIVVTRSNKRANRFNEGIRQSILWKESELERGDLLMVVKNNYFWAEKLKELDFIANGDIVKVISVRRHEDMYGYRFANVTLEFLDYKEVEIDCKIMLNTLTSEGASLTRTQSDQFFNAVEEDYIHIGNKRDRWLEMRKNEYFNALQIKYAYAVTCHKAQGGQWDSVFVDQGYLTKEMIDIDFLRWFYTAFTRPRKQLYLVNFDKAFFEEDDNEIH